jgi:hypothetical protein
MGGDQRVRTEYVVGSSASLLHLALEEAVDRS